VQYMMYISRIKNSRSIEADHKIYLGGEYQWITFEEKKLQEW
jgi:hypothetical protein